jgi:NAD(P)H-dependent FMN reductase
MDKIVIISSSVRRGRKSHRVALYFKRYIEDNELAEAEILDLREYNFPIFDERLSKQDKKSAKFIQELLWCIEAKKRMTE